ncbi:MULTISPECIES: hypothetical protein [Sphingobium]|uniref:Phage shock protein B n=1 Tax=Sphingobium lignivorans TaxID=2735886 RepID=A0ABR6NN79_9SPHN|nr:MULTISPECIES: hypothetical protein [Sphingobium]MBB5987654.1 hypothetical protein [Sphingobium lignivorans]BAK68287.1 hypothetical protein SLG_36120 [Sphingobium sp. SYK-6]
MDKTSLVLGFFLIVVGIPVIADVLNKIHKRNTALRERELEIMGSQTAEKAAQYAARTERLEQRVRVLERIVTDKGLDLAAEIDGLREEPVPARPIEH